MGGRLGRWHGALEVGEEASGDFAVEEAAGARETDGRCGVKEPEGLAFLEHGADGLGEGDSPTVLEFAGVEAFEESEPEGEPVGELGGGWGGGDAGEGGVRPAVGVAGDGLDVGAGVVDVGVPLAIKVAVGAGAEAEVVAICPVGAVVA